MIKERRCSYEVVKLLKEKGFREWCRYCYGTAVRHNGEDIDKDEWVYDIYHNESFFRPLLKKWIIDRLALTREEALAYIGKFALDSTSIAIINF